MKTRLSVLVAIGAALVLASTVSAAPQAGKDKLKLDRKDISAKQCKTTGEAKKLVDVTFTLLNDSDQGDNGDLAWANDTINRRLRIWSQGDGTYCAQLKDQGTFVTYAGESPGATDSQIPAGIEGTIDGGSITADIMGTFDPSRPTRGDLGTFDLMCDRSYNCPGDLPTWNDYFDAGASGTDFAQWGFIYKAGSHGTWLAEDTTDEGDITA